MPRQDRTGPLGQGEKTGKGQGPCCGAPAKGLGNGTGCGGRGRAGGQGLHRQFNASTIINPQDKKAFLENETILLKNRLDFITKELDNISNTDEPTS